MFGMKNISIVPVFNQKDSYVWARFVCIEDAAMRAVYKYKATSAENAFLISQLCTRWHWGPCFAFAAYDDDRMVGCVHGTINSPYAKIQGLYVLPQYHRMGIGARLLTASERAVSVYADFMNLVALGKAENFYRSHNYSLISPKDCTYVKRIGDSARRNIVPIFVCPDSMVTRCEMIATAYNLHFDVANVNSMHLPMFAYLNENAEIDGYIACDISCDDNNFHVSQLCLAAQSNNYVACKLIENMARMNIR